MIRVFDVRPLVMIAVNLAMMFILHSINDLLSVYGLYIVVPILFIVVPAVYLNVPKAIFVIFVSAMAMESFVPVRGLSFVMIWLLAAFVLRTQRFRFRRINFLEIFVILAALNTFIILLYGICFFPAKLDFVAYIFKLFNDAFFSLLFLIYTSAYIVKFHFSLFKVFGLELNLEKESIC